MKRYIKSTYVETFAITLIVLSVFAIIAACSGFFYAREIPPNFAEKGSAIPEIVYLSIYITLGIVAFYNVLLVLASACLLVLNIDKRR